MNRLQKWIRYQKSGPGVANGAAEMHACIEALPQEMDPANPTDLVLLPGWRLQEGKVFLPMSCYAMVAAAAQLRDTGVCLVWDGKWNAAPNNLAILTIGFLVAGTRQRNTTMSRGFAGRGSRRQGRELTTQFRPFMQAIVSSESTGLACECLIAAERLWPVSRAQGQPLPERVVQLHKDFARCLETARANRFPLSRSCGDFAHMARNVFRVQIAHRPRRDASALARAAALH